MTSEGAGTTANDREALLSRSLAAALARPVTVQAMMRAPGGNSRETWIADLQVGERAQRVVFRCDPDAWIRPLEMRREIAGLRLAAAAGVPAPRLLVSCEEVDVGRPYVVTDYVAGTTLARRVIRDPAFAAARAAFATQCGRILARLHAATGLAAGWEPYDPIAELHEYLARAAYPSPVFRGAVRWLEANRPAPPARLSPVHRDFRLGNLMIGADGIVAVLDWETCQLGEPEEDLAWLCSRSWRYGAPEPVGGVGGLEDLLEAYERERGAPVDRERLHWWSVYAETRWGVAGTVEQRAGTPGDRMEQAAITRRGCRQEQHVLLELERYVRR